MWQTVLSFGLTGVQKWHINYSQARASELPVLCHCTCIVINTQRHSTYIHVYSLNLLVSPQEQDTLGDAEERCTQLMHKKVQLEESVQVICYR